MNQKPEFDGDGLGCVHVIVSLAIVYVLFQLFIGVLTY